MCACGFPLAPLHPCACKKFLGALVTLPQEHLLVGLSCQGAWVGELGPGLGGCGIPCGDCEGGKFHSIFEVWGQYNLPASRTSKELLRCSKKPTPLLATSGSGWGGLTCPGSHRPPTPGVSPTSICSRTPRNSSCFLR